MKTINNIIVILSGILFLAHSAAAQDSTYTAAADTIFKKDLDTIMISASRPALVMKNDKITLTITQSPLATGDNILSVIKRMPGIIAQGGVQFRGKKTEVYINDRPSRINADDLEVYLGSMPANTVEKVEIITNPSAKYDASGAVVINIVLAKNKNFGTNGTFTQGIGTGKHLRYNSGLSLNYRNGKMNMYGGYDYSGNKTDSRSRISRSLNTSNTIMEDQYSLNAVQNHAYRLGLDYELNKKSSAGFLIKGITALRTKNMNNRSVIRYFSGMDDSSSTVTNTNRLTLNTPSVNIYFKTKLGKVNGDLTVNADIYQYTKDWSDHFITRFFDEKNSEYALPSQLRDQSPADNTIRSLSADYSFTINKISYEMGIKALSTITDNNVTWETVLDNKWTMDPGKTNHFIYRENIQAAYFSAARSFKKLDLTAGVRVEHTNATGHSVTLAQVKKNDYVNIFPSLDISYNQSDKQQFSIAYRRKIERFGFNIVNPFIVYQSQYAYYQGNPDIKPTFSDNIELAWSYDNKWSAAVSYGHFTDVLADMYKKGPGENTSISTYDNVAAADQLDISVSHSASFFNGAFTTDNTLGGLFAKYNAGKNSGLNNAGYTAYFMSSNSVQFAKTWKGQLNMYYYSPLSFGAYQYRAQFSTDLAVARPILKAKGSLTLSITDVFNTNKPRYGIESYDVKAVSRNASESRFVKMSFSYRFGNKNIKASRARQTGIDDVQRRMAN